MAKKGAPKRPKPPPTAEELQKAQEARKAQIADDQALLDDYLKGADDAKKKELFDELSAKCSDTTMKDGKVVLACPLPTKLDYCSYGDPFDCKDGKVEGGKGCKLSGAVSEALKEKGTCIDGQFVSVAEGGSYGSPYVPWGPVATTKTTKAKDGTVTEVRKITPGNSSGVTIGTGVDLGAIENPDAYLKELEQAGVSKETRDTLRPMLGKRREKACAALREAKKDGKPIVFPQADVEKIDQHAFATRVPALKSNYKNRLKAHKAGLQGQIDKAKKAATPDQAKIGAMQKRLDSAKEFKDLSCADQTILFSTLYHEGSVNGKHMNAVVTSMIDGDESAVAKALEEKSKNANKLLSDRGKRELKYLQNSIKPPAALPKVPTAPTLMNRLS